MATAAAGVPLFEIFIAKNGETDYGQQVLFLDFFQTQDCNIYFFFVPDTCLICLPGLLNYGLQISWSWIITSSVSFADGNCENNVFSRAHGPCRLAGP